MDLPEPGPGRLLVRTRYSGISSGTELLAYRGLLDPDLPVDERIGALGGTFRYPFPYGYSCVGEVERSAGAGRRRGRWSSPSTRTRTGSSSARTTSSCCPRAPTRALATLLPVRGDRAAAQPRRRPGGAGDRRRARARRGRRDHGAPAAAGRRDGGRGRSVASERRDLAASLGIPAVEPGELPSRLPSGGVPLLLELSGSPTALAGALDLLAHEGTALVGSWYGSQPVELPLGGAFHRRRLTIRSSQVSTIPAALAGRWDVGRRRAGRRRPARRAAAGRAGDDRVRVRGGAPRPTAALDSPEPGAVHVALRYQ